VGNNLEAWMNKKQAFIYLSTAEAEYILLWVAVVPNYCG
jgi:hypothetical protein